MFQLFGDLICQGIHYSTGQIPQIPYQENYDNETKKHIEYISDTNIKISEDDWNAFETSWDFAGHPLVSIIGDDSKYSTFIPDKDNIIPIMDEEYFENDIFGLLCSWIKKCMEKIHWNRIWIF